MKRIEYDVFQLFGCPEIDEEFHIFMRIVIDGCVTWFQYYNEICFEKIDGSDLELLYQNSEFSAEDLMVTNYDPSEFDVIDLF